MNGPPVAAHRWLADACGEGVEHMRLAQLRHAGATPVLEVAVGHIGRRVYIALDEHGLVAAPGQEQRRCQSGDPAADHRYPSHCLRGTPVTIPLLRAASLFWQDVRELAKPRSQPDPSPAIDI